MRKLYMKVRMPTPDDMIALVAEVRERPWRDPVTGQLTVAASRIVGPLWAYSFAALQTFLKEGTVSEHLAHLGKPATGQLTEDEHEVIRSSTEVREDLAAAMIESALPAFMSRVTGGAGIRSGPVSRPTLLTHAYCVTTRWPSTGTGRSSCPGQPWLTATMTGSSVSGTTRRTACSTNCTCAR